MICNPMITKKSGGQQEWQKLQIDSSQDVPMPMAADPTTSGSFELHFEQRPSAILFRTLYAGGQDYYSMIGFYLNNSNSCRVLSDGGVGVTSVTVNGDTITGTFAYTSSNSCEFLPIYN